jgi:ribosomal protein L11 methyltransferase
MNYEGFEEEGDLLKAYIPSSLYEQSPLRKLADDHNISFSVSQIEDRNWNALWESNFRPVVINHSVSNTPWIAIRAAFHKPIENVEHEIIINPKMSFGTGHHPTTMLMIKMMGELEFKGKTVLDFGTGTGILAILARKLGAAKVIAVDSDPKSIQNASENFDLNNCDHMELLQASVPPEGERYDIILCNIIKTVFVNNLPFFHKLLQRGGNLLVSGLLKSDDAEVSTAATKNKLALASKIELENWIGMRFTCK